MSLSTLYRKYTPIQVRSWISELREAGGRKEAQTVLSGKVGSRVYPEISEHDPPGAG